MTDKPRSWFLIISIALLVVLSFGILFTSQAPLTGDDQSAAGQSGNGSVETALQKAMTNPLPLPLGRAKADLLPTGDTPELPYDDPAGGGIHGNNPLDASGSEPSGGSSEGRSLSVIPGCTGLPTDPDNDGIYEDLSGNGYIDFSDVIIYYDNKDWISENQPVSFFDHDGDSIITEADILKEFDEVPKT